MYFRLERLVSIWYSTVQLGRGQNQSVGQYKESKSLSCFIEKNLSLSSSASSSNKYSRQVVVKMSVDVRLLREEIRSFDQTDETGRTALHRAVLGGDQDEVKRFLSLEAEFFTLVHKEKDLSSLANAGDAHGVTPLMAACEHHPRSEMSLLMAKHVPADVNRQDAFGRTALHWACSNSDLELVEVLVCDRGADVKCTTTGGDTPLHWAASSGSRGDASPGEITRVIDVLVNKGAVLEAANETGGTPASIAESEEVRLAIQKRVDAIRAEEEAEALEMRAKFGAVAAESKGPSRKNTGFKNKKPAARKMKISLKK